MSVSGRDWSDCINIAQDISMISMNIETFRNSFMYKGAVSWNSLPPHLKYATTHDSFKRLYKKEYFYAPI